MDTQQNRLVIEMAFVASPRCSLTFAVRGGKPCVHMSPLTSHTLYPSKCLFLSVEPPASPTIVGSQSVMWTSLWLTVPRADAGSSGLPPVTKPGTLTPPSYSWVLKPRRGNEVPPWPAECDDVVRSAHVSRCNEQQATASSGRRWIAPSVSASRFSAGRGFVLVSHWPPCAPLSEV